MSLPGASAKFPGVIYDIRLKLNAHAGTGTTHATIRRLRRLSTRLPEEQWLEAAAAVMAVADLASSAGKTRAEIDEQLREILQQLGSDDDEQ